MVDGLCLLAVGGDAAAYRGEAGGAGVAAEFADIGIARTIEVSERPSPMLILP